MKNQLPILDAQRKNIGHWSFEHTPYDGFGTERSVRYGHIKVSDLKNGANFSKVEGGEVLNETSAANIFLHFPSAQGREMKPIMRAFADISGMMIDCRWPVLKVTQPQNSCAQVRLVPSAESFVPEGYLQALARAEIPIDVNAVITALQSRLTEEAEKCASKTNFCSKYGVTRILVVGSTSRLTYASKAPDFDLLIHTTTKQAGIRREDIRLFVDCLLSRLKGCRELLDYIRARGESSSSLQPNIRESFFGVRGKESFVSRHQLILNDANYNLFDITFGFLPQLIRYEMWVQHFFEGLERVLQDRIRNEIRLAKCLFGQISNVSGIIGGGLSGYVIEQFIIQGLNYRSHGEAVGSLANSLELIVEEATPPTSYLCFNKYKTKFPLWHPGWWETDVPFREAVNMWNVLGKGDSVLAERQWKLIKAAALVHNHVCKSNLYWDVSGVATAARKILEGDFAAH